MPASRFAGDSAVEQRPDGTFVGQVHDGWAVVDGAAPNGGYLLAMGARAIAASVGQPDPVSVTGHFLAPPTLGPIEIRVDVLRQGRRHATAAAQLVQNDTVCVAMLTTFGDLDRAARTSDLNHVTRTRPQWPPIDECVASVELARQQAPDNVPQILERFDHRQDAAQLGWAVGKPTGVAVNGGYIKWPDSDEVDPFGLLVVADCYAPPVFNLAPHVPVGWSPTIELTVQIRKRPAPGFLTTKLQTTAVTSGYLEEDGEYWDTDGDLVALSRQIALAARPR
ncbi:MAG: thioesterase family protein [Nitriliruptoraceae bacterium]